jgi:hypothetical protein
MVAEKLTRCRLLDVQIGKLAASRALGDRRGGFGLSPSAVRSWAASTLIAVLIVDGLVEPRSCIPKARRSPG